MAAASYDLIVAGIGAVGSATLWQAARRGLRVLGLDRFPAGHDRGSSHGRTRIIRQAYFEHPDYVPLLLRTYALWAELAAERGETLFEATGLLQVGPADGAVVPGVLASARLHGLQVDALSASECRRRFPGFFVGDDQQAAYEASAGVLHVERCVVAAIDAACRRGAELRVGESVISCRSESGQVAVETERGTYQAARLVVSPGPWASQLLTGLGIRFEVRRKPVYWFAPHGKAYAHDEGCPAYLFELPDGVFYGFPSFDSHGVKVAEHSGGAAVEDPLSIDRSARPADRERLLQFTSRHLPRLTPQVLGHSVCMYTMSPDEHFVVDRHPEFPAIAFAAGLSGHGFKFAPVLGQALVELAIDGRTSLPIEFLASSRPGLRG